MDKEAEKTAETAKRSIPRNRIIHRWMMSRIKIKDNYTKTSLVDLVENTLDIAMDLVASYGIGEEATEQWKYYIEFFNCCSHPGLYDPVGTDARELLLRIHTSMKIRKLLDGYSSREYGTAVEEVVKRKKEDILKFWDEYVEKK